MPTLMETAVPLPHPVRAPEMLQPALVLSFGGVDFSLTPSDSAGEVSYKNKNQEIVLDLSSFTGFLKVSLKGSMPTVAPLQTTAIQTARVEQEPNSPEVAQKTPSVTPGQTKLSFQKKTKKALLKNKKSTPLERKRVANQAEVVTPKTITKKSRNDYATPALEPTTLCQTMVERPTQATQDMPDFSQTMDTSDRTSDGRLTSDANSSYPRQTTSTTEQLDEIQRNASVREIMDRVNSSNDSVATVRDDDDKSIVSKPVDKLSIEITEEKPEVSSVTAAPMVIDEPKTNPSPCPRWGHSMTKIKDDRVLVYGGQSFDLEGNAIMMEDVHVYNMKTRKWEKIHCRGEQRQWHSATYLPDRQLLITFGGESKDLVKKDKVVTSNNLRVLDTDIMLWYPPAVSGNLPSARSGHTATLLPNTKELVLFGGVKGSRWLNTVSVLDTVRWVWSKPEVEGVAPKPRSYHTTTVVKGSGSSYKLVVFGGNNKNACFSSIHVLETNENMWKWTNQTCSGKAPFPRTGHSATLLEDGKTICIYGGWDPNDEENIFKGSFLLDTDTWTWKSGPKASSGGSGGDYFVEDCGPKRCGHTSVMNNESGEVMVFGGRIPGEILAGDFQTLKNEQDVGLDD